MKNAMKAMIVLGMLIFLVSSSIVGCGKTKDEEGKSEQNQRETSVNARQEIAEEIKQTSNADSILTKEVAIPEKDARTSKITFSNGVFQIGDFSVALSSVERKEKEADLHFAITKVKNTGSEIKPLAVTLTDDHENNYTSRLEIIPYNDFPLNLLPVGFTYVKAASVGIPKPAPIETIQVGDTEEMVFERLKLVEPQLKSDFGTALLQLREPTPVGEFLLFSIDGIVPDLYTWALAATIENKDYNQLRVGITCAVQFTDGKIAPPETPVTVSVSGLSKEISQIILDSLRGKEEPQKMMLLVLFQNQATRETVLKLWPISTKDFPPRVGQGTNEGIFIEAYRRNGGREAMGDPLSLPRWFAGGGQPKNSRDLLIQEFPVVSQFGKSAILWDKQNNADKAYVIHGAVWETYLSLGGSESWLGYPVGKESVSTKGHPIVDFEGGYIGTQDGITFEPYKYPTGKIAFVGEGAAQTIYTINVDGTNRIKLQAGQSPAWSPDGNRIAFTSWTGVGLGLMDAHGSNVRWLGEGTEPAWSPDGRQLAFNRKENRLWGLWTMNLDATDQRKLTDSKSYIRWTSWSPAGNQIAFEKGGFIHLINIDGSNEIKLAAGSYPAWSPDGSRIAYISSHGAMVMNTNGSGKTVVEPSLNENKVVWSPDGAWLAVTTGRGHSYRIRLLGPGNRLMDLQTKTWAMHPSWWAPRQSVASAPAPAPSTSHGEEESPTYSPERSGKQELVAALEDLQSAMIKKIQLEVDITAQSFTSVKEYRRAKLLADLLRPVLRVIQGTLSVLSKISDTTTLSGQVKTSLDNAQYVSEATSLFFMANGLRESGEKLYYAIDDTAGYVRTVKDMLQAADQTTVVRMNPRAYKQVIKQYLDSEQGTPLVIARTSELAPDKKPAKGALVLYKTIREEFRTLIDQIQRSEIPPEFPINDVVAEIEQLKHQIVEAGVHNIDVHYSIYHQGRKVHQSRKLGAVAEHNKAFAQVAGALAKRLDIEIYAECAQLAATGADAAYIVTYKVPGAGEAVKMTQQVSLLPQIVIEGKKMFTVDPEEQFYQMPQEMLFSLAIEFSSLLRIADDTVLSLTELLKETRSQVPPSEVQPTPTSTKQKEPAKQIEKQVEEAVKSLFKKLLRKKR